MAAGGRGIRGVSGAGGYGGDGTSTAAGGTGGGGDGAGGTGEAEAVLLCGRCTCKAEAEEAARATAVTEIEPPPRIASRSVRYEAVMRRSDEINAGTDDSPPTRPSERTTDNKEPRT